MGYELGEAVYRLADSNPRLTPPERHWRNLDGLEDEAIIDLITTAYEDAANNIQQFCTTLSLGEYAETLPAIGAIVDSAIPSNKYSLHMVIITGRYQTALDEAMQNYRIVADYVYDKFCEGFRDTCKPGLLLNTITVMNDPELADKLLHRVRSLEAEQLLRGAYQTFEENLTIEEALMWYATAGYIATTQARLGAAGLKSLKKTSDSQLMTLFDRTITEPLAHIKSQPPLALQLFRKGLAGVPPSTS